MDFKKYELTSDEINNLCKRNLEIAYAKIDEDIRLDKEIENMLKDDEFE
jgi:hypothetical protein